MFRFAESFDPFNSNAVMYTKWTGAGRFNPGITGPGRFGVGQCLVCSDSRQGAYVTLDSQDTWIVGAALQINEGAEGSAPPIFTWYDFSSGTTQGDMRINSARKLVITRNGTVLATGTTVLPLNTWFYVQFYYKIHDTAGVAKINLEGNTELSLTSQDTRNGTPTTADTFFICGFDISNVINQVLVDDLVIMDGQTGAGSNPCNDFIGDVRVECKMPNGNGATSNLVGSDGNSTNNYQLVDEKPPNDDTDYVESSTVGDKDTYTYEDSSVTSGTVFAVQTTPYARKTDAGVRKIKPIARLSTTEVLGAEATLASTYRYSRSIYETKPGGGDWTISDFNNAEFGVQVTA